MYNGLPASVVIENTSKTVACFGQHLSRIEMTIRFVHEIHESFDKY